jgi:hypothetical protein
MHLVRRAVLLRTVAILAFMLLPAGAHADLNVGPGGLVSLGSGAMDLACTDILVASTGVLRLDSAPVTGVRNITVQSGGLLDFGSGSISFSGAFVNHGTLSNLGANSIISTNIPSCAPQGPSITGVYPVAVPGLNPWGILILVLLIAGFAAFASGRQSRISNPQE